MPSFSRPPLKSPRRTASTGPRTPGKRTHRSSISSSAMASALLGVEHVAQPVAEQVEAQPGDADRHAGEKRHPPLVEDEATAGGDHRAPFRRGRLRAEAEEAEPRRGDDDPLQGAGA